MGGGCVLVTGGLGFIGALALDCDTGERGGAGGRGAEEILPPPPPPRLPAPGLPLAPRPIPLKSAISPLLCERPKWPSLMSRWSGHPTRHHRAGGRLTAARHPSPPTPAALKGATRSSCFLRAVTMLLW